MAILKPAPTPGAEQQALAAIAAAAAGGGGAGGAHVYMGRTNVRFRPKGAEEKGRLTRTDRWFTEDDAMAEYYNKPEAQRRAMIGQFVLAGLVPYGAGDLEGEDAWQKLVQTAARFGQAGNKVSPYDLLKSYVDASGGTAKNAWQNLGAFEVNVITGEKRYAGPGVYLGDGRASQTDTRVDLTDPDTARAMATKLFQQMMGRDPGAGELSSFARALATAEAANPVTQTTVTQYNMDTGQPISQDTTSSGGVSAEGKALIGENQIKGKKEYGVNQAVTTYQGALEQLIYGSPG